MASGPSILTFLFTDIVGSTDLTDSLGDEGAQEILRLHNALLRAQVAQHGGSEVKAMGDGFMITFPSVQSALACAVSMQRAIGQHNQEQPTREFMVRMGLNAGEAIREEGDFFGAAVIAAARIAALAEGGEILASEAVRQLSQGMRGADLEFKGEFQLKGLREPFRIYRAAWAPAGRPGVAALRRPPFVGREKELEDLKGCLEQAAAGAGLLVLLSGEPGIGKTRLAGELARHARTRGFRVWRGRCYQTVGTPPYVPFVEVLRDYMQERPDDVLLDELGDDAPELAKLVPELARRLPLKAESAPLPPEQERYRLVEAFRRWLERIALRRPTFLLIEDVHWAGPASSALLRHLAPSLAAAPMFILATCRSEELNATPALSEALAEFGRLQVYRRLNLEGLSEEALQALLAAAGEGPPPPALTQALLQQTEGNPFFVAELVNHLAAEGRLFDASGQWLRELPQERLDIPDSVRVVIRRRLGDLNEGTRRVLTTASVMGRDFTYDLLDALADVPSDALLDSLDEALRMGMIEESEGAAARFRFAHELTRQTLYEDVSGLRRQRLHLRVGTAMEEQGAPEPAEVAYHLAQAGTLAPADKTRRYLILAGDEARRMAAWEGAAAYYQQAIALMAPDQERERADLLRALGEGQSGMGDWEGAVASWKEAMEAFERLGDAESAGWLGFSLRKLYGARGQFSEAAEVVDRSLRALGEADSEIRSRLLAQAGFVRSAFGEREEAERLLEESTAVAQRLDNPGARGFAAFIRGMHCLSYCRLAESAEWLKQGSEWSQAAQDPWTASQSSSFRRHILFTLGDLAEAERDMDEEERLAHRAGNFLAVCETKWVASEIACLRGDLERGEALAAELIQLIESSHAESGLPGGLINLAYSRFLRGDWDSFEELLSRAASVYERMSAAPIDDPRPVLLLLRALAGRADQARQMLAQVEHYLCFDDPWTTALGEARITLAAALAVLGQSGPAAGLYQPLKDWTRSSGYVLTGASSLPQLVSRVLAMAAALTGREDDAVQQFEKALSEARTIEATTELAETCYWYARFLLDQGQAKERDRARDLLAQAARAWQQAAMPKHLERARRLEAEAGGSA